MLITYGFGLLSKQVKKKVLTKGPVSLTAGVGERASKQWPLTRVSFLQEMARRCSAGPLADEHVALHYAQ